MLRLGPRWTGPPALECSDLLAGGGFLGGATLWLGFCSQHSGIGGEGSSVESLGYRASKGLL